MRATRRNTPDGDGDDGCRSTDGVARGAAGVAEGLRSLLGRTGSEDAQALPAADGRPAGPAITVTPGPEELRKQQISGRQRWYAGAVVGLSFLLIAMVQAGTSGGSLGTIVAFEVLAACFGAVYLFAPVYIAGGRAFAGVAGGTAGRVATIVAMLAITVPMIAISGTEATSLWIYVGVVAAVLFPLPWAVGLSLVLAATMLTVTAVAGGSLPWELALTLVALTLWMAGFVGNVRLTVELRATREELAHAAVAAERARIGRDLHDILGHSLTAIAVKAGLARRLVSRDVAAAEAEIADVERLAREALSDVRATAAGYRDVSLAAELAVARSVLAAAGIQPDLPTAVDNVTAAGRQVFGYVVREAVTNVVRHSGARHCTVELTPTSIQITDDGSPAGRRAAAGGGTGAGLRGLADRLAAAGGTLQAAPLDGGGFRVLAEIGMPPNTFERAATMDVPGSDVPASVVSASDVSGSDLSASDLSASDVSASEVSEPLGQRR